MKDTIVTFLYIAIWGAILFFIGEEGFPRLLGPYVQPTTKAFWLEQYAFFNAGGTIPWSVVTSLFLWVLIGSFGAIMLLITGPTIIPAIRKYMKSSGKPMPKKRKIQYPSC